MRIYTMTATFGKLEHDTLTLQPGLNIIEAHNEWGKSTWCAFLVSMLYGIDTSARSTKAALADKERYAPWSGHPMAGRIDLEWEGRDITIERKTKGRAIFGDFRAFETATGIPVPELTAANCGQQLLGVERSVFIRAGFLRLTDLPVTQDEALRRRLNALVTTGDESGAADNLAQKLRDLKNRCRFNRSGLLPQAQAQAAELEGKLTHLQQLQQQSEQLRQRQEALNDHQTRLENHRQALQYRTSLEAAARAKRAKEEAELARQRMEALEQQCAGLPEKADAQASVHRLQNLRSQFQSLEMERQMLPASPTPPNAPGPFRDLTGYQAIAKAEKDSAAYRTLSETKAAPAPLWLPALLSLIAGILLWVLHRPMIGIPLLAVGMVLLIVFLVLSHKAKKKQQSIQRKTHALCQQYGDIPPENWVAEAQNYAAAMERYSAAVQAVQAMTQNLQSRTATVESQIRLCTNGVSLEDAISRWTQVVSRREALEDACREYTRAVQLSQNLESSPVAQPPSAPDPLTYSQSETARLLSDAASEQRQLQLRLGQCQGQMVQLGQETELRRQLKNINDRIIRLENTYTALTIAQDTLARATEELQRRFAPRIAQRAQTLFSKLTGARYDRLSLSTDMGLHAGAADETTLRPALWRSDGTVDQLYLALRLAVAEELTPAAPLILDDALVRFDDRRLAAAMDILKEMSLDKQILLFTCQSRENAYLNP